MSMEWMIAIAIAAAALVVSIVTLVNVVKLRRAERKEAPGSMVSPLGTSVREVESGNVFCRSCGNMYDSTFGACPACHTPRG